MLYREIIAVVSEIHTKHINTVPFNDISGGTCGSHLILKGSVIKIYLKMFHHRDFSPYSSYRTYLCGSQAYESHKWLLKQFGRVL
jgi:hypothetical protein